MKYLQMIGAMSFIMLSIGVASYGSNEKTWDQVAAEIESWPEGSTYNFPKGAYTLTRPIMLKSEQTIILPDVMYLASSESAMKSIKHHDISVLNIMGFPIWKIKPGAHDIFVGVLEDK